MQCKLYFRDKANELAESQLSDLSSQLEAFQTNLETFAREHKDEIKKDPKFRKHFQVWLLVLVQYLTVCSFFSSEATL